MNKKGNPNFVKGNKGGPGRPRGSSYVDICRKWAEQRGWKRLIDIADGKEFDQLVSMGQDGEGRAFQPGDSKVQIAAMKILIEYGYGKPRETVDVNMSGDMALRLSHSRARLIQTDTRPA